MQIVHTWERNDENGTMVPAAIFDFLMSNKYRLDEDIVVYNNHRPTSAYLMEKASDGNNNIGTSNAVAPAAISSTCGS